MSAQATTPGRVKRRGIDDFVKGGTPIVGLTAYTAPIARLLTRMLTSCWSGTRSEWWSTGSTAPCR
jgi:hypothetical protein